MSNSCNPMDCSLPDSSVHGIFQVRILEWLPFPSPGDLPDPRTEPISALLVGLFPAEPPGKPTVSYVFFITIAWVVIIQLSPFLLDSRLHDARSYFYRRHCSVQFLCRVWHKVSGQEILFGDWMVYNHDLKWFITMTLIISVSCWDSCIMKLHCWQILLRQIF